MEIVQLVNTFQGEGEDQGKLFTLVRFKKCMRRCPFCDTQEMMRRSTLQTSTEELRKDILQHVSYTGRIMFTGGEPLLYLDEIRHIIDYISVNTCHSKLIVNIETAGTYDNKAGKYSISQVARILYDLCNRVYVKTTVTWSPKIFTKKDLDDAMDFVTTCLDPIADKQLVFKFLYPSLSQYQDEFCEVLLNTRPNYRNRIFIMPLGAIRDELYENIPDACNYALQHGFNISPRLHILLDFV